MGADGAGKTTISEAVTEEVRYAGQHYEYWWCGWREFRSLGFRLLRSVFQLFAGGSDTGSTGSETNGSAGSPGTLWKLLGLCYFPFVFIDHYLTTAPKAFRLSRQDAPVVYDRYFYGMVIGFSAFYAFSERTVRALLSLSVLYPSPDIVIYLDVDPETAYERKDDVPSPEYIACRREYYRAITDRSEVVSIDATQSPDAVKADVLEAVC